MTVIARSTTATATATTTTLISAPTAYAVRVAFLALAIISAFSAIVCTTRGVVTESLG